MERMKKVVSLLLCLVMVVGLLPMSAIAASSDSKTEYLMLGSDRHGNTKVIGQLLTQMGSIIGSDAKMDYVGLLGDMVDSTNSYDTADILEEVQSGASYLTSASVDIVYAAHDKGTVTDTNGMLNKTSGQWFSGTNYYVYGVIQNDMDTNYESASAAFVSWANNLPDDGKAIVVISHMPIHAYRGDNTGGGYWHNALNTVANATVAEDGTISVERNVLFFHGHNHTEDGTEYFYEVGDTMSIENYVSASGVAAAAENTVEVYDSEIEAYASSNGTNATIYYTYATAGYMLTSSGRGGNGHATLLAIGEDTISLARVDYSTGLVTSTNEYAYDTTDGWADVTRVASSTDSGDGDGSTEETTTPTEGETTTETKEVYVLVDTMTVGEDYLIANGNSGNVTLLGQSGGSAATTSATVTTSGDYTYIETADSGYIWNATAHTNSSYSSYPRLINAESYAMYASSGSLAFGNGLTDTSGAIYTRYWTYTDGQLACVSTNSGSTTYYLTYSDGYSMTSTATDGIYIYEKQTITVSSDGSVSGGGSGDTDDGEDDTTGGSTETVVGDGTYTTADDGSYQKVTFETTVTGTKTKTVYVLSSGNPSGTVLIANSATAGSVNLVANDGGDLSNTSATVVYGDCDGDGDSEYYIELDDATNELWTVSGSYTFENQDEYLRCSNGNLSVSSQSTTWSYSSNHLRYKSGNKTYYLRYNSGWNVTDKSNSAGSIYFYVPTEVKVPTTETTKVTYSVTASDIEHFYTADEGDTETVAITASVTDGTPDGAYAYEVVGGDNIISSINQETGVITFNGAEGTAQVKVSYTWTDGENTYTIWQVIDVTATSPYYTLDLHKANIAYTEATGLTEFAEGTIYYTQNEDGTYTQVSSDATFDSSETYYTLSYTLGDEITAPIAIKGIEEGDRYGVWAVVKYYDGTTEDGTDIGTVGDAIEWSSSDESIATVDKNTGIITFTGKEGTVQITATYKNGNKPSDTVTISVTQSQYSVPADGTNDFPEYPNEGAIRYDKTATAVGNFSETGIAMVELSMTGVPYSSGSLMDIIIAIDWTNSMDTECGSSDYKRYNAAIDAAIDFLNSILINEAGELTGHNFIIYKFVSNTVYHYTLNSSTEKNAFETITLDDLADYTGTTTAEKLNAFLKAKLTVDLVEKYTSKNVAGNLVATNSTGTGSTWYSYPLEAMYSKFSSSNTGNKEVCVFLSDGAPSSNYVAITGTDSDGNYTYEAYDAKKSSGSDMGDWVVADTSSSTGYTADPLPEYYSTLAKEKLGVEIFAVGLGVDTAASPYASGNNNSNSDGYSFTDEQYETLVTAILNEIASDSEHVYTVTDNEAGDGGLSDAFEDIAVKIMQAATDVTVEDKITDEYTMIFDIPTDRTYVDENGNLEHPISTTQEFYIEFLKYTLDASTHERVDSDGDGDTYDDATSVTKLYLKTSTDDEGKTIYSAASDASDTAYAAPVFAQAVIGEKGTLYYWTTDDSYASKAAVTYTNSDDTYYFIPYGMEENADGTAPTGWYNMTSGAYAYGTVDSVTNTSTDLVIATPYFVYNASTKMLYWTVDKLDTAEYALRYFLYLDNSATDVGETTEVDAATYPTNDHAYITYTNFRGNDCQQKFPIPQLTWNGAQVSYVFYLVNAQGQPINKSGQVVDFANATFVTDVYTTAVVWNKGADGQVEGDANLSIDWLASKLLPSDYLLYDTEAGYELKVYADASGEAIFNYFIIEGSTAATISDSLNTRLNLATTADTVSVETTKVYNTKAGTKYDDYGTYTSKDASNITGETILTGFDFANSTVAFAVVWQPKLVEDVVVVDYGLDVVINVVQNDLLQNTISGIGVGKDAYGNTAMNTGVSTESKLGTAALTIDGNTISIENENAIRFHQGDMEFTAPVEFYYESPVKFYEDSEQKTGYMYSSVTVIPATTIYYEDDFLTLTSFTKGEDGTFAEDTTSQWVTDGNTVNATQDQDRPGAAQISKDLDADNNYGYDSAYEEMSTHSMGSAAMINVDAATRGEATFTFYGTGFDVISMTSNTTGTLIVQLYSGASATGDAVKSLVVDTYYGYTQNADGDWVVSVNDPNALYQVPVMKMSGLTYGRYTVKIVAGYNSYFDNVDGSSDYDLYLDAVRIYDPTGNKNTIANNAYMADGEGWPIYKELRNLIIDDDSFGSYLTVDSEGSSEIEVNGVVFIDSDDTSSSISNYTSYGPNNELYLAPGQAVAFEIADVFVNSSNVEIDPVKVQLAIKTTGSSAKVEIFNPSISTSTTTEGTTQTTTKTFVKGNLLSETIETATDMYYDITALVGDTIVISNPGEDGIISITNLKFTFDEAASVKTVTTTNDDGTEETSEASVASISEEGAVYSLRALRSYSVSETTEIETEPTEPEVTEPETEATEPETEATEPETEATEPETEATEPETEVTEPETEATEPEPKPEDSNTGKTLIKIIKKLLGWLFG